MLMFVVDFDAVSITAQGLLNASRLCKASHRATASQRATAAGAGVGGGGGGVAEGLMRLLPDQLLHTNIFSQANTLSKQANAFTWDISGFESVGW